jgi:fibronectin type 3 domain-containing protein
MQDKRIIVISLLIISFYGCERPVDVNQPNTGLPPAVPTGVGVYYASDGEIIIDWNTNNNPELNGYNVYRKSDSTDFKLIYFTQNNYYIDDSLSYDITYYYYVTSEDIFNKESSPSDTVNAQPINRYNPYQPTGLSINARNWDNQLSVYLTWYPNNESDVRRYNIYRSEFPSFTADTSTYIGYSSSTSYSDTFNLSFYLQYYYRIKAVDNGGLQSIQSGIVNDEIYPIPEVYIPQDSAQTSYFSKFLIKALEVPATYQVVVQTNQYFGEFYNNQIYSTITNDTLGIDFTPDYLYGNTTYYWRIIIYSDPNGEPNSISPLYNFTLAQ